MAYHTETEPIRGQPADMGNGILRIVAPNASVMTYHGTNTYLLPTAEGWMVVDPGPDDDGHVAAILAATSGRIWRILVTHGHQDHAGAVPALRAATGSPVGASLPSVDDALAADITLREGDRIGDLTVVESPGHTFDHVAFAHPAGVLLTGDHVMGWSSTVVRPPRGSMRDYMASLRKLMARTDHSYLPGHGPPVFDPHPYVRTLYERRQQREDEILELVTQTPADEVAIAAALYHKLHPRLVLAAQSNVASHLAKLADEGRVVSEGDLWRAA